MQLSQAVIKEVHRLMNYRLTDLEIYVIMEKDGIKISKDKMIQLRDMKYKNKRHKRRRKNTNRNNRRT